jgi:hypothetical protein
MSRARKVGHAVHRNPLNDTTTPHRFLRHLRATGFQLVPEPLGFLADGTERLSYIEGRAASPPYVPEQISDDALVNVSKVVRQFHDAGSHFAWPSDNEWHGYDIVRPAHFDCIGHNDLAPWNFVFDGSTVSGIIDWDACGPSSRIWDFAYTVHHFVPFHPDNELEAWGWSTRPHRYERLQLMVEAYGSDKTSIPDLLDAAILRLASMGSYIARRVRLGDPAFAVEAREDHASAYFAASAHVVTLRKDFLSR